MVFYLKTRKANYYKPGYNHVSAHYVVGRIPCQTPHFSWSNVFQQVCVAGYEPVSTNTEVFSVHHTSCNPDFRQPKKTIDSSLTGNESPDLPSCVRKSSPQLQSTFWKLEEFCFGLISWFPKEMGLWQSQWRSDFLCMKSHILCDL